MTFMLSCRMNFGCDYIQGGSIRQIEQWAREDAAERDVERVTKDVAVYYLLISMANFTKSFQKD